MGGETGALVRVVVVEGDLVAGGVGEFQDRIKAVS